MAKAGKSGGETMKKWNRFGLFISGDRDGSATQLASFFKKRLLVCNLEGYSSSRVKPLELSLTSSVTFLNENIISPLKLMENLSPRLEHLQCLS